MPYQLSNKGVTYQLRSTVPPEIALAFLDIIERGLEKPEDIRLISGIEEEGGLPIISVASDTRNTFAADSTQTIISVLNSFSDTPVEFTICAHSIFPRAPLPTSSNFNSGGTPINAKAIGMTTAMNHHMANASQTIMSLPSGSNDNSTSGPRVYYNPLGGIRTPAWLGRQTGVTFGLLVTICFWSYYLYKHTPTFTVEEHVPKELQAEFNDMLVEMRRDHWYDFEGYGLWEFYDFLFANNGAEEDAKEQQWREQVDHNWAFARWVQRKAEAWRPIERRAIITTMNMHDWHLRLWIKHMKQLKFSLAFARLPLKKQLRIRQRARDAMEIFCTWKLDPITKKDIRDTYAKMKRYFKWYRKIYKQLQYMEKQQKAAQIVDMKTQNLRAKLGSLNSGRRKRDKLEYRVGKAMAYGKYFFNELIEKVKTDVLGFPETKYIFLDSKYGDKWVLRGAGCFYVSHFGEIPTPRQLRWLAQAKAVKPRLYLPLKHKKRKSYKFLSFSDDGVRDDDARRSPEPFHKYNGLPLIPWNRDNKKYKSYNKKGVFHIIDRPGVFYYDTEITRITRSGKVKSIWAPINRASHPPQRVGEIWQMDRKAAQDVWDFIRRRHISYDNETHFNWKKFVARFMERYGMKCKIRRNRTSLKFEERCARHIRKCLKNGSAVIDDQSVVWSLDAKRLYPTSKALEWWTAERKSYKRIGIKPEVLGLFDGKRAVLSAKPEIQREKTRQHFSIIGEQKARPPFQAPKPKTKKVFTGDPAVLAKSLAKFKCDVIFESPPSEEDCVKAYNIKAYKARQPPPPPPPRPQEKKKHADQIIFFDLIEKSDVKERCRMVEEVFEAEHAEHNRRRNIRDADPAEGRLLQAEAAGRWDRNAAYVKDDDNRVDSAFFADPWYFADLAPTSQERRRSNEATFVESEPAESSSVEGEETSPLTPQSTRSPSKKPKEDPFADHPLIEFSSGEDESPLTADNDSSSSEEDEGVLRPPAKEEDKRKPFADPKPAQNPFRDPKPAESSFGEGEGSLLLTPPSPEAPSKNTWQESGYGFDDSGDERHRTFQPQDEAEKLVTDSYELNSNADSLDEPPDKDDDNASSHYGLDSDFEDNEEDIDAGDHISNGNSITAPQETPEDDERSFVYRNSADTSSVESDENEWMLLMASPPSTRSPLEKSSTFGHDFDGAGDERPHNSEPDISEACLVADSDELDSSDGSLDEPSEEDDDNASSCYGLDSDFEDDEDFDIHADDSVDYTNGVTTVNGQRCIDLMGPQANRRVTPVSDHRESNELPGVQSMYRDRGGIKRPEGYHNRLEDKIKKDKETRRTPYPTLREQMEMEAAGNGSPPPLYTERDDDEEEHDEDFDVYADDRVSYENGITTIQGQRIISLMLSIPRTLQPGHHDCGCGELFAFNARHPGEPYTELIPGLSLASGGTAPRKWRISCRNCQSNLESSHGNWADVAPGERVRHGTNRASIMQAERLSVLSVRYRAPALNLNGRIWKNPFKHRLPQTFGYDGPFELLRKRAKTFVINQVRRRTGGADEVIGPSLRIDDVLPRWEQPARVTIAHWPLRGETDQETYDRLYGGNIFQRAEAPPTQEMLATHKQPWFMSENPEEAKARLIAEGKAAAEKLRADAQNRHIAFQPYFKAQGLIPEWESESDQAAKDEVHYHASQMMPEQEEPREEYLPRPRSATVLTMMPQHPYHSPFFPQMDARDVQHTSLQEVGMGHGGPVGSGIFIPVTKRNPTRPAATAEEDWISLAETPGQTSRKSDPGVFSAETPRTPHISLFRSDSEFDRELEVEIRETDVGHRPRLSLGKLHTPRRKSENIERFPSVDFSHRFLHLEEESHQVSTITPKKMSIGKRAVTTASTVASFLHLEKLAQTLTTSAAYDAPLIPTNNTVKEAVLRSRAVTIANHATHKVAEGLQKGFAKALHPRRHSDLEKDQYGRNRGRTLKHERAPKGWDPALEKFHYSIIDGPPTSGRPGYEFTDTPDSIIRAIIRDDPVAAQRRLNPGWYSTHNVKVSGGAMFGNLQRQINGRDLDLVMNDRETGERFTKWPSHIHDATEKVQAESDEKIAEDRRLLEAMHNASLLQQRASTHADVYARDSNDVFGEDASKSRKRSASVKSGRSVRSLLHRANPKNWHIHNPFGTDSPGKELRKSSKTFTRYDDGMKNSGSGFRIGKVKKFASVTARIAVESPKRIRTRATFGDKRPEIGTPLTPSHCGISSAPGILKSTPSSEDDTDGPSRQEEPGSPSPAPRLRCPTVMFQDTVVEQQFRLHSSTAIIGYAPQSAVYGRPPGPSKFLGDPFERPTTLSQRPKTPVHHGTLVSENPSSDANVVEHRLRHSFSFDSAETVLYAPLSTGNSRPQTPSRDGPQTPADRVSDAPDRARFDATSTMRYVSQSSDNGGPGPQTAFNGVHHNTGRFPPNLPQLDGCGISRLHGLLRCHNDHHRGLPPSHKCRWGIRYDEYLSLISEGMIDADIEFQWICITDAQLPREVRAEGPPFAKLQNIDAVDAQQRVAALRHARVEAEIERRLIHLRNIRDEVEAEQHRRVAEEVAAAEAEHAEEGHWATKEVVTAELADIIRKRNIRDAALAEERRRVAERVGRCGRDAANAEELSSHLAEVVATRQRSEPRAEQNRRALEQNGNVDISGVSNEQVDESISAGVEIPQLDGCGMSRPMKTVKRTLRREPDSFELEDRNHQDFERRRNAQDAGEGARFAAERERQANFGEWARRDRNQPVVDPLVNPYAARPQSSAQVYEGALSRQNRNDSGEKYRPDEMVQGRPQQQRPEENSSEASSVSDVIVLGSVQPRHPNSLRGGALPNSDEMILGSVQPRHPNDNGAGPRLPSNDMVLGIVSPRRSDNDVHCERMISPINSTIRSTMSGGPNAHTTVAQMHGFPINHAATPKNLSVDATKPANPLGSDVANENDVPSSTEPDWVPRPSKLITPYPCYEVSNEDGEGVDYQARMNPESNCVNPGVGIMQWVNLAASAWDAVISHDYRAAEVCAFENQYPATPENPSVDAIEPADVPLLASDVEDEDDVCGATSSHWVPLLSQFVMAPQNLTVDSTEPVDVPLPESDGENEDEVSGAEDPDWVPTPSQLVIHPRPYTEVSDEDDEDVDYQARMNTESSRINPEVGIVQWVDLSASVRQVVMSHDYGVAEVRAFERRNTYPPSGPRPRRYGGQIAKWWG